MCSGMPSAIGNPDSNRSNRKTRHPVERHQDNLRVGNMERGGHQGTKRDEKKDNLPLTAYLEHMLNIPAPIITYRSDRRFSSSFRRFTVGNVHAMKRSFPPIFHIT
jgi:hypothetical protein